DGQLRGFHVSLGAFDQRLRLLIPRDPSTSVEEGPVQQHADRPGLVEILLRAAICTLARDVRQEVAKGLSLPGLGGRRRELGAAVLRSLAERIAAELLA